MQQANLLDPTKRSGHDPICCGKLQESDHMTHSQENRDRFYCSLALLGSVTVWYCTDHVLPLPFRQLALAPLSRAVSSICPSHYSRVVVLL